MTDGDLAQLFPPMHPVTRLGRVIQQLRSFGELHAGELEALATELTNTSGELSNAGGELDAAARLRIYRDLQRDEAQMVIDELLDIQAEMAATGEPELAAAAEQSPAGSDPAINSPRRARWLAEQAEEEERRRQPLSRRDFFSGGAKPDE